MPKEIKNEDSFICKESCGKLFTEGQEVLFDGMYFYNEENTIFLRSTRETSKFFTKNTSNE